MKHTVFITGAAGYIGGMLVEQFARREDVERVIALDKESMPQSFSSEPKVTYIQSNTADAWEEKVRAYQPDIVIHTAWQIRELYGDRATEWKWNVDGSDKVFNFAFTEPFVQRLVHFSTVASYGAFSDNTLEQRFVEHDPFRKSEYLYAEEKRITEEHLRERFEKSDMHVSVAIVRPAAITGPRGRFMRIRFGLQSSLSGSLKGQGSLVYNIISLMVSWVPVTPKWLRQYIHEDDVVAIVDRLSFGAPAGTYEVFNICPPGPVVLGADMARAVGKRMLPIRPWMVRLAFFWTWHLTRGKIPTAPGSWRGYSYPIAVDGSKVTRVLGYSYRHSAPDAFQYTDGTYESFVPEASRRHKQ